MQKLAIPSRLSGIAAPTAAEICQASRPQGTAARLLTPELTPSQYLAALHENQLGVDMIKFLAHGLCDRDAVVWATRCAEAVVDRLPPADVDALRAAAAWVRDPSAEHKARAADAVARTDARGPGAWAAQAAAWAGSAFAPVEGRQVLLPRLTPEAVLGAVLLSAALQAGRETARPLPCGGRDAPHDPDDSGAGTFLPVEIASTDVTDTYRMHLPFIAAGLDIAAVAETPG